MELTKKTWDQRLYTLLWIWIAFRTLVPWLVFFRLTFEGDSYRWATSYFGKAFHSSGFARPDFLLVYALLAIGIFLLFHLRRYNFRIAAPVLTIFLGILVADALYELAQGEPIIFQGDTLGIRLNISVPFFILQFGMFVVAVAWWLGIRRLEPVAAPQLARYRKIIVWMCIAIVPVQLVLLMSGEPHALTDEIGVILTLSQWALLAYAFYPGSGYR